jgi:hypothetical protein
VGHIYVQQLPSLGYPHFSHSAHQPHSCYPTGGSIPPLEVPEFSHIRTEPEIFPKTEKLSGKHLMP